MKYSMVIILLSFLISYNSILQAQWIQTTAGGAGVQCMIVKETGIFVGTHAGGVFLSTDNGLSWTAADTGLTNLSVQNFAANNSYLFAATYNGGVFLSTNDGKNWTAVNIGLSNLKVYGLGFYPPNVYAGTDGSGLFLSTNYGNSWTNVGFTNKTVGDIAVRNSIVFAGVSYSNGGVYRSMDSCKSWTLVMNGVTDKNVLNLAVNGSNLYLGTAYNGLFLSTNDGDNWTNLNNGLTDDVWFIVFHNSNFFASTGHGVYLSTNSGADWINVSDGLTNLFVTSLVIQNNYLFAGCGNNGWVWRRPLSEMITDVKDDEQLPKEFTLYQNYPNPFNPSTKISWQLPVGNIVKLKVYDILGREIITLVNEYKPLGKYETEFNAANFPSGVYFYRIQAGSFVETKKMMLLK